MRHLPKEEKNCRYTEEAVGVSKAGGDSGGYNFSGSIQIPHKKEEMMMYGIREVNLSSIGGSAEMMSEAKNGASDAKANIPWKTEPNESCFLQSTSQEEAYHNFLGAINDPVKAESVDIHRQHNFHCGFLEGQSPDCLSGDRHGPEMGPRVPEESVC